MGVKSSIDDMVRLFLPVFYALFLFCGLAAAIASGIIEYNIFKQFFTNAKESPIIYLIPLLLAVVFEITKIFLVFYKEQLGSEESKRRKEITILRGILIAVSIIATLVFAMKNLESPEAANVLKEKTLILSKSYEERRDFIDKQINELDEKLDGERVDRGGVGKNYRQLLTEKERKLQERDQLYKSLTQEKITVKSNVEDSREADNIPISKFISSIWRVFSDTKEYPREIYYSFILLMSVALSVGLEIVIIANAFVISKNHQGILDFSTQESSNHKFKKITKYTFIFMFMLSVIVITGETNIDYLPLSMFFVLFLILFIVNRFFSSEENSKSKPKKEDEKSFWQVYILPPVIGAMITLPIGFLATIFIEGFDGSIDSGITLGVALASTVMGAKIQENTEV